MPEEPFLQQTESGLVLTSPEPKAPVLRVDFIAGALGYRRQCNQGWNEALVKALKIKRQALPLVFDLTAGLGTDTFLLATLGCTVIAVERHPTVHALLADGLKRAEANPELAPIIQRITLHHSSAADFLKAYPEEAPRPEMIYLDPMFPARTKSAAVKKGMTYLQALVGKDEDAHALLPPALVMATKRVVVKRSPSAPPLTDKKPDIQYPRKRCRFDVYLSPKV